MPLEVKPRASTGALTIVGTVAGTRVRQRASSDDPKLAAEEATTLEAKLLRTAWHGERRGSRSWAEGVQSFLEAEPRAASTVLYLLKITRAVGIKTLAEIDQEEVDRLCRVLSQPGALPATKLRNVIAPIRAVLRHAARRKWCDEPSLDVPKLSPGRTLYMLPGEANRLIAAAAPHMKPLFTFLLCTGARVSEALDLEWRDVDLRGARAIFWKTKGGKRRVAMLPPAAIIALANIPHREGAVFRWESAAPKEGKSKRTSAYADRQRAGGGQFKTAWRGAIRRAGLSTDLRPHDLRHTWASWHYALHRDLLRLKLEGGWSSVDLVERYAHLMPAGQEQAIEHFWHLGGTAALEHHAKD